MDKSHEYQFDADKIAQLEAENAALREQLAAAQKDAERYQRLRAEADRDYVEFNDRWYEAASDLDAAVDSLPAIEKEKAE